MKARLPQAVLGGLVLTAALGLALPGMADPIDDLMLSRLGTLEADPVLRDALEHAALPVTDEIRAKALECWQNGACDTGTDGALTVAYADGFGENVWRRVTAMEFIMQALTYPEIGRIQYSSARSDAAKAISDLRAYIAQGVDVIVVFADHGPALGPTIREATEAGIKVVLHNGTEVGTPGEDYLTNLSEDICGMGAEFIRAIREANPQAKNVVALGGVPGNPLSATWLKCAKEEVATTGSPEIVAEIDTNWSQEGTFTAVSTALAQFGTVDGYIHDYADGFRGGIRAYQQAGKPLEFTFAVRTDEQGLFCDWEDAGKSFNIYYSSGQNFQARFSLTAAMRAIAGEEVPARIAVPFKMKPASDGLCNRDLPMEVSVSTLLDAETLKRMFAAR